ncbi:hypothetical protein MMC21_002837 [Puttea exsequens]|nr:hypothetical protein [Puttea exsequens]
MSANEIAIPFVYAGEVYAAAIVLPIVGIATIGLRLWLRSSGKARIGIDDWLALAALFPVIGMGLCLIYGTAKGAIGHASTPYPVPTNPPMLAELYETTPEQTIVFTMDWIIWVLMIPGNGLIKLSALFLYRRIFVVNKNSPFDIVTMVMIAICSLWTVGFFLAQIFGCGSNFGAPFGTLTDVASCNTNVRLDALMISDLITDILVWILPIPVVWGLNMSVSKKLSITGILSLAAMSLAAAIVRLIVQEQISNGGYAAHTDVNLTLTILLYWSMLESGLALIAACLPTLHYLVSRSFISPAVNSMRRLISSTRSTSTSNTLGERPYYEVSSTKLSDPTHGGDGPYELSRDMRKVSDVESGEGEWAHHGNKGL